MYSRNYVCNNCMHFPLKQMKYLIEKLRCDYFWIIIFDPENCWPNFGLSFFWCKGIGYTVFFCTTLSIKNETIILNYSYYFYLCMFEKSYFINHYEELSVFHNEGNRWSVKSSIYCSLAFLLRKLHIRETSSSLNDSTVLMLIYPFIFDPVFYIFHVHLMKIISISFCNRKKKIISTLKYPQTTK